jgi:hypothetical protein
LAEWVSFCMRNHIWTEELLNGPSNIWICGRAVGFVTLPEKEWLKISLLKWCDHCTPVLQRESVSINRPFTTDPLAQSPTRSLKVIRGCGTEDSDHFVLQGGAALQANHWICGDYLLYYPRNVRSILTLV